jgi:hypothetical protein
MVGKEEMCALFEDDLMNEETVNRLRNPSWSIFQSLREIFSTQYEARKSNLSRKRKSVSLKSKVLRISLQSTSAAALNPPKSNQKSQGTIFYHNTNNSSYI